MVNKKDVIKKLCASAITETSDGLSITNVCKVNKRIEYNEPSQFDVIASRSMRTERMSITRILATRLLSWTRYSIENLPIKLTLGNLGVLTILLTFIMPRTFTYIIIYPIFRLIFGTLYPAYASYKAVRTKNVKEYVKWMMYWIVFALFTCVETFTDVFFSFWFPFYYEIKIIIVLWLLSPATKGSSILYRRFVHPALIRREAEIDDALARATEQGYTAVLHLGTKGVNYATTVLMQTAIKVRSLSGVIKTYSALTRKLTPNSKSMTTTATREVAKEIEDNSTGHLRRRKNRKQSLEPMEHSPVIIFEELSDYDDAADDDYYANKNDDDHGENGDDDVDDDNHSLEENCFNFEDEASLLLDEFKAPTEKPKNTKKKTSGKRKNILTSRKATLRSYDAEFSDDMDVLLSDLTGEKEDENRNTSTMHDETDMIVEPRRRENPGRRGYSPRRTQSSCNRVDMFFPEVDVDVRQPRHTEPITSLNNIRSSDDISSGYSSGEALQTHRMTPHTESLLRTSSVGARTRSSKPRSTTKKVPEDEEEEWNKIYSDTNASMSSLSFLNAQKTLELLLYLSHMHNYIPSNFPNTRISEILSKCQESKADISSSSSSITDTTVCEKINDSSENADESLKEIDDDLKEEILNIEKCQLEETINKLEEFSKSDNNIKNVTDEICPEKFIELKELLNNAHEAATNIVNSNENANSKGIFIEEVDLNNLKQSDENRTIKDLSRSHCELDDRAGKYHKKPAPKVPVLSTSHEEIMDVPQEQQALKATLVIKTGTVTTFTNSNNTKSVFVSNNSCESLKTKKKRLSQKNLSKFLAIPKNLFNSAFNKDQKHLNQDDDANSSVSQGYRSRSSSIESREVSIDNSITQNDRTNDIEDVENLLLKIAIPGNNSTTDSYVDFRIDSLDECNTKKVEFN
ncbi:hypothetical protein PV325_011648 [Microctonus aethiopoides]|nr:hypothetical protein PV325_011648 [Microctonus aethiopoides]